MKVTIEDIKKLREETGGGIIECRTALEECDGDFKKAKEWLLRKGIERAVKKEGRETVQGIVDCYIHATGKVGAMVALTCETDFVARTDDFKKLAHEIAMQIASMDPKDVNELLKQEYIRDPKKKIGDLIKEVIGKLGENIVIKSFKRLQI
ncbi:translation elongation factor Ts [Candidatus Microgenomates bacterium]|nr:translation elongation factor Ts [Candidatus Microgenomates bacterium]